jgi:hypothetical protein
MEGYTTHWYTEVERCTAGHGAFRQGHVQSMVGEGQFTTFRKSDRREVIMIIIIIISGKQVTMPVRTMMN